MEQMTQREMIELIKIKKKEAENSLYGAKEKDRIKKLAYINCYEDMICDLNRVVIIPECNDELDALQYAVKGLTYLPDEQIVTTIPKAKQEEVGITKDDLKKFIPFNLTDKEKQKEFEEKVIMKPFIDELKKIDPNKIPITPYNEPKIEPLRDDRFREFKDGHEKKIIDAKAISSIEVNTINQNIQIYDNGNYSYEKFFKSYDEVTDYYQELVEWWKYWKQN